VREKYANHNDTIAKRKVSESVTTNNAVPL
jgi:hypothetical protein